MVFIWQYPAAPLLNYFIITVKNLRLVHDHLQRLGLWYLCIRNLIKVVSENLLGIIKGLSGQNS